MRINVQVANLLSLVVACAAIDSVSVAKTVQAGTDISVSITTDFSKGAYSVDAHWEHYRLYLSEDQEYWVLYPLCFLSPILPWNITSTTVNIPADVGPDRSTYRIHAEEFNGAYSPDNASSFQWSDHFTLEGSTIEDWSPHEANGYKLFDAIPCTAYNCNRKCIEKTSTRTVGWYDGVDYCACLKACPGVVTENPFYGAGDGCGWQWRNMASETAVPSTSESSASAASTTHSSRATSAASSSPIIITPTGGVASTAQPSVPTSTSLASALRFADGSHIVVALLVSLFALSN